MENHIHFSNNKFTKLKKREYYIILQRIFFSFSFVTQNMIILIFSIIKSVILVLIALFLRPRNQHRSFRSWKKKKIWYLLIPVSMDFSALTRRDFTRCNPLTNNPVELFGITRRTSRVTRRKSKRDAYFWQRIEFGNSLEI